MNINPRTGLHSSVKRRAIWGHFLFSLNNPLIFQKFVLSFSTFFALSLYLPINVRSEVTIHGAGATFPYPLYSRWIAEFQKIRPQFKVNYQAIGSGGGIQQLLMGAVDFAASDVTLQEKERQKVPFPILQIPTVLGAISVVYNLDSGEQELRLSAELLVKIFLGQVGRWNDPLIAAQNPGFPLPDKEILVIHRSDGSGTTAIFTEYLSTVSELWKRRVGKGKSVKWPVGLGVKGNDGVAGLVKRTKGSLSFVELSYALQNHLPIASLKNRSGNYIKPTIENLQVSSQVFDQSRHPSDPWNDRDTANVNYGKLYAQFFSLFNGPFQSLEGKGENIYPLTTLTYLLVPLKQERMKEGNTGDPKTKAINEFLLWVLSEEAQKWVGPLHYAPLPLSFRSRLKDTVQHAFQSVKMTIPNRGF